MCIKLHTRNARPALHHTKCFVMMLSTRPANAICFLHNWLEVHQLLGDQNEMPKRLISTTNNFREIKPTHLRSKKEKQVIAKKPHGYNSFIQNLICQTNNEMLWKHFATQTYLLNNHGQTPEPCACFHCLLGVQNPSS